MSPRDSLDHRAVDTGTLQTVGLRGRCQNEPSSTPFVPLEREEEAS